jgi:hypothetical protein
VLEDAVDHVGDGLQAAVRVQGCPPRPRALRRPYGGSGGATGLARRCSRWVIDLAPARPVTGVLARPRADLAPTPGPTRVIPDGAQPSPECMLCPGSRRPSQGRPGEPVPRPRACPPTRRHDRQQAPSGGGRSPRAVAAIGVGWVCGRRVGAGLRGAGCLLDTWGNGGAGDPFARHPTGSVLGFAVALAGAVFSARRAARSRAAAILRSQ